MFGSNPERKRHGAVRRHTVSFHVTSSISGRTRQRTFSRGIVRALIGAGVGLVLVVGAGVAGLFGWIGSSARMRRLQAENDSLRVQFQRLGELEVNLARMSELNEQMQRMLGVDLPVMGSGADSSAGAGVTIHGEGLESPAASSETSGEGMMTPPDPAGQGQPRRKTGTD